MRDRYRVVAVDHIGCGLSDKPAGEGLFLPAGAAQWPILNELIEKLDLRQITLVAHDWGGAIGMGAAVAAPERFARFVLMNTAAFRMPHCPWPIRALPPAGVRPAGRARAEPVRPGRAADDRLQAASG